jgi:hypothetical protein
MRGLCAGLYRQSRAIRQRVTQDQRSHVVQFGPRLRPSHELAERNTRNERDFRTRLRERPRASVLPGGELLRGLAVSKRDHSWDDLHGFRRLRARRSRVSMGDTGGLGQLAECVPPHVRWPASLRSQRFDHSPVAPVALFLVRAAGRDICRDGDGALEFLSRTAAETGSSGR